jgi:mono/diheme cytochrome c family protein
MDWLKRQEPEIVWDDAGHTPSLKTAAVRTNTFDAAAARGQKLFERQGCATCHTPPLYSMS